MINFPKITAADAGCWLEGSQGWHNTYRVIDRAISYGWYASNPAELAEVQRLSQRAEDSDPDLDPEVLSDASEEATEYLQGIAPEGYVFEWDAGELCLLHESETDQS
jgi:hypothetical protein